MISLWFLLLVSQWSVRLIWLMCGLIQAQCLMLRFTIHLRTRNCWILVRFSLQILLLRVLTRLVVGSLRYMPSPLWCLITCLLRTLFLMVWCSTKMVKRCRNAWAMQWIHLVWLNSMVPILCVGICLLIHLLGITWNLMWTVLKKFAVSSSVLCIIPIHSCHSMLMWMVSSMLRQKSLFRSVLR